MTIQQAFEVALQHHQSGRLAEAEVIYRQILAVEPRHAGALHLLGLIAHQAGRHEVAVELIGKAIALVPNYPEAHSNLGNAFKDKGQIDEAITSHLRAIALKPDWAEAHSNLGIALKEKGHLDEAIASYRRAVALKPDLAEAHSNLGIALKDKGQPDDAIASYRRAVALKPDYPEAHSNLGVALQDKGQLDEAIASYHQAIALNPNYPEAHSNLGGALLGTGQLDEAITAFRRTIEIQPADPKFSSYLLLTLNCHPGIDAHAIAEEHRRWNHLHAKPLRQFIQPHRNDPTPDRRLRIGYVSPDFCEHPVGRFLLPLLAHHDRRGFEIFAYAQVPAPDGVTERLRTHTDAWRSLVGLSDAQAADLIRQDRIDILVDLAGHTANNRLLVFARKPAPVQVTWLGYPNTTGLDTIDYRLTDSFADPLGQSELHYSEKLIRLSRCAWCFAPGACPPVAERRAGPVTFGCFNNFAKVTEPMLSLWGRILGIAH